MMFTMSVMCDCAHPDIHPMDPQGIFDSDLDEARCYAWKCPFCLRQSLIRLTIAGED